MHHFSALKLLVALVVFIVCIYPYVLYPYVLYPYVRIVRRTGHSGW